MEHLVITIMREIKKREHPLAIYGAGGLAVKIAELILKERGGIDAFVVDSKYITWDSKSLLGIPVISLEEFIEKNREPDIIIGFEGKQGEHISNKIREKIHNIYAADFLGYLALGEANYISDDFYNQNSQYFEQFSSILEDDLSRDAWQEFIHQKRSGCYSKGFDQGRQYFDKEIIGKRLSDNECFADCGGFRGETVKEFIEFLTEQGVDKYMHIHSFEPDHDNVIIMKETLSQMKDVDIIEAGVFKTTGRIFFAAEQGASSRITENGENTIDSVALDDYFADKEPPTFIKMDVEGAELDALHGAERIIREHKPKLAVCIYHKKEDLVDIPKYLIGLDVGYKFYVRNYSLCGVETVLYAV